jgi:hypothetical protein
VKAGRLLAALCLLLAAPAASHPPRGIVVAPDGRVIFSDLERIWAIEPGGRMRLLRRSVGAHTHELFMDDGGHLWGEDSFYDPATRTYRAGVWMIAPDGRTSYTYGPTGRLDPGVGVFRDRFGCSYLSRETRARALLLHRLCPAGQPQLLSNPAAARQAEPLVLLANLGGAAFGPDGSFFFRHRGIVQRLRAGDRLVTAATGFAPENFGIHVDEAERSWSWSMRAAASSGSRPMAAERCRSRPRRRGRRPASPAEAARSTPWKPATTSRASRPAFACAG